ncbi:MAG: ASCH domain-containing protein [SAR202 cluster bacterium]|nr:ASCH domain-containing protein [SAR202 cluster bacterium]
MRTTTAYVGGVKLMTSNIPSRIQPFWDRFIATVDYDASSKFYEAFHFDDNEPDANALAKLVLNGTKQATAGLLWASEYDDQPLPKPGDFSVVTNWDGKPLCVIETTQVDVRPYEDVTEEFAAVDGEGDGSLRHWRDVHWRYFSRECARIDKEPDVRMLVICERFNVVYQPDD